MEKAASQGAEIVQDKKARREERFLRVELGEDAYDADAHKCLCHL
jgi:hypothetical protein